MFPIRTAKSPGRASQGFWRQVWLSLLEGVDGLKRDFVLVLIRGGSGAAGTEGGKAVDDVIVAIFRTGQQIFPDVEGQREGFREIVVADEGLAELGVDGRILVDVLAAQSEADHVIEAILGIERAAPP